MDIRRMLAGRLRTHERQDPLPLCWWECAFASNPGGPAPERTTAVPAEFPQRIRVPFSPEALLSGVGRQLKPDELLWYRRTFDVPALEAGERLLLLRERTPCRYACRRLPALLVRRNRPSAAWRE